MSAKFLVFSLTLLSQTEGLTNFCKDGIYPMTFGHGGSELKPMDDNDY